MRRGAWYNERKQSAVPERCRTARMCILKGAAPPRERVRTMKFLNVEIPVKNLPELDEGFVPLGLFFKSHQALAKKPVCIAVERSGGQVDVYEAKIIGTPEMQEADEYCIDRLVKFLLWSRGGYKVTVCGDEAMAKAVRDAYTDTGARAFDKGFMEQVYETQFTVESAPYENRPQPVRSAESIGRLWTAHASVLTPAGRTARSAPSSTARPCTAKRWSGTPRPSPTRAIIIRASWPRCTPRRPTSWSAAAAWTAGRVLGGRVHRQQVHGGLAVLAGEPRGV